MLKSIFIQLWNNKQSNIWLLFELLLVFCIVWYMVDYFFVLNYNRSIPSHRNTEHTWEVKIAERKSKHPDYREEYQNKEIREANYIRVLQTIKNHPEVEAISTSFWGSSPESTNQSTNTYMNRDSVRAFVQDVYIDTQWDFFKVFDYTANGKPVSVEDFDWNDPRSVVIGKIVAETLFPGESAIGKIFTHGNGKGENLVVGVVDDVKRFDYLRPRAIVYHPERDGGTSGDISLRANSSIPDNLFKEKFLKEMSPALQIGNFYLKGLESYKENEVIAEASFGVSNEIRIRTSMMIFFLLCILICVVGTFWYKVNMRTEEVGLRKALGSSKPGIRNLFIIEGLCLLTIVLIPAMIIEYQFVHAGLISTLGIEIDHRGIVWKYHDFLPDKTLLRFLITNSITWVIMAVTIAVAIWLPATKAASLEAADALRDE